MSVFRVKLSTTQQGLIDYDPSTNTSDTYGMVGEPFGTHQPNSGDYSVQRGVYVMGPNKTNRLLIDGQTFTDCNYWKKFAVPQTTAEFAIIEVVTDDGSVYSDVASENTFGVGGSFTLATSYNTTNVIDFVTTHGGPATYMQVRNNDGSIAIEGRLNGVATALFTLAAGETQIFNSGDLAITQVELKSASGTPTAEVLAAVRSVCNS